MRRHRSRRLLKPSRQKRHNRYDGCCWPLRKRMPCRLICRLHFEKGRRKLRLLPRQKFGHRL